MAVWEHPLQLFSLDHPDEWEPEYQAETGGVLFTLGVGLGLSALSINPVAISGDSFSSREQLHQAAQRVGVALDPTSIHDSELADQTRAYGEGIRKEPFETPFRFWVIRHHGLVLFATHLGPGAGVDADRRTVTAVLEQLSFPEILPPTPEEFRSRVLEILTREYASVLGVPSGEWGVELRDANGDVVSSLGLENLYRACLLNAEVAGALIREHLDEVLSSPETELPRDAFEAFAPRLLPMLKAESWVEEVSKQLKLAKVEFTEGLVLCFALDEPKRLAYVTQDMLDQWDVPLERLQQVAQDNLAHRSRDLPLTEIETDDKRTFALIINTQDGYDAARLVLPSIRESLAEHLGDEFLVGLPNRDFLIAFAQFDPELKARIVRQVKHDFQRMHHPLSQTIYRVRMDHVEPTDL